MRTGGMWSEKGEREVMKQGGSIQRGKAARCLPLRPSHPPSRKTGAYKPGTRAQAENEVSFLGLMGTNSLPPGAARRHFLSQPAEHYEFLELSHGGAIFVGEAGKSVSLKSVT